MKNIRYVLYVYKIGKLSNSWQFEDWAETLPKAKAMMKRYSTGSKKKYKLVKEVFLNTSINGVISKHL
jgi:hypothetical protein